jgi:hypothetical protein
MRPTTLPALLLLCILASASGCVPTSGGYYDDGYDNNRGYYNPRYQQRHGGTYYDQDSADRQQRRQDANCNMNWQNCVGVCNQLTDANQRYVCVANCNNALNQCKSR